MTVVGCHPRLSRFGLLAVLVAVLSTGCFPFAPGGCATLIEPGVVVEITDARSGLPRAGRSTGVVVDGAYVDSLVPAGFSDPADPVGSMTSRQGAFGRAGVYSLRVQSDGYQTWTLSGVRVKSDGCSVVPERVQAALQPVR
jgi:hypothetical protein